MEQGKAKITCGGIAIAPVFEIKNQHLEVAQLPILSVEEELARLNQGAQQALEQISALIDKQDPNSQAVEILEFHLMLCQEDELLDPARELIAKGGINAAAAILQAGAQQAAEFKALDDPYMQERSADILDVAERIGACIAGVKVQSKPTSRVVIVADDLTPSQTAAFEREYIAAIVLRGGTANSHAAILARNMGIPSLIRAQLPHDIDGQILAVDAIAGNFYLNPDATTLSKMQQAKEDWDKAQLRLLALRGKPSHAPCGHKMLVCANIGTPDEIEFALENDCEGVGLMRSEFLFIGRETYPTEEEQYQAYARVATALNGRPLVIRTLDIGADKKCPYFNLPEEENPALGLRALRICLLRPELFKVQIRAICRAAARGKVLMMLPMVTSLQEIKQSKALLETCLQELAQEGKEYARPQLGIMIETPAAAILSAQLATEVDFFSIDTNDLMQYTCALDRQNAGLSSFYDPHHPALLELIKLTARNAHQAGIWIGICGELGSDLSLIDTFIEYGIDELSVSPSRILAVREKILHSTAACLNRRGAEVNF